MIPDGLQDQSSIAIRQSIILRQPRWYQRPADDKLHVVEGGVELVGNSREQGIPAKVIDGLLEAAIGLGKAGADVGAWEGGRAVVEV